MALYSMSVDGIALGAAAAKTIAELGTGAQQRAKIKSWSITFDGVTASAVPVKVEIGRFSAAVTTATTYTINKVDPGDGNATTVAKHSTTAEGAGTASDVEIYRIPPTGGMLYQEPLGNEWIVPVSGFWRIRCTAPAAVNVTFTVKWEE